MTNFHTSLVFSFSVGFLTFSCQPTLADAFQYGGGLHENMSDSLVLEVGFSGSLSSSNGIWVNTSAMYFFTDDKQYNGLNLSSGYSLGDITKLYIGLGVFIGENKICSSTEDEAWEYSDEIEARDCEYDYIGGIYPELNLSTALNKFRLGVYSRAYKTFESGNKPFVMTGFFIGIDY